MLSLFCAELTPRLRRGVRRVAGAPTSRHRCRRAASKPSWVPRSTITPSSSTRISSASTTVDSRCAIISVVRRAGQFVQARLDFVLGARIERTGRFVEDQYLRIFQDHACDGHSLLFAAGQFQPALAHAGRVAVREFRNEIGKLRPPRRLLDSPSPVASGRP